MRLSPKGSFVAGLALAAALATTQVAYAVNEIHGTSGPDQLVGTPANDEIRARAGADQVLAHAGRDVVFGDEGRDSLGAGDGRDVVFGDLGRDLLLGRDGNDALIGGAGDDVVSGGGGRDILGSIAPNFGFAGDDTLRGGRGSDVILEAGNGNDVLRGGPNKKGEFFFGPKEYLQPGPGADIVFGGSGPDLVSLRADGQQDIIRCGPGHDEVVYDKRIDRHDLFFACEKVNHS